MATQRVSLLIHCQSRSLFPMLLTASLLVVVFLSYLVIKPGAAAGSTSAERSQVSQVAYSGVRSYYLSQTFANGLDALGTCDSGYHMASLWEILDPSNLRYNQTLGITQSDQGSGPPSYFEGWIRTGFPNHTSNVAGRGNCDAWNSNQNSHYGSSVYLPNDWTAAKDIYIWTANSWSCDMSLPVWCVSDEVTLNKIFLPMVRMK